MWLRAPTSRRPITQQAARTRRFPLRSGMHRIRRVLGRSVSAALMTCAEELNSNTALPILRDPRVAGRRGDTVVSDLPLVVATTKSSRRERLDTSMGAFQAERAARAPFLGSYTTSPTTPSAR